VAPRPAWSQTRTCEHAESLANKSDVAAPLQLERGVTGAQIVLIIDRATGAHYR
jgi:hypothetical protein